MFFGSSLGPKVFKIIEPISNDILRSVGMLDALGIKVKDLGKYHHPQEDYLAVSKKLPIFAVADGVTLEYSGGKYPNPSGAGEAANIFCQSVIKEAEKIYGNFIVPSVKKVFAKANVNVGVYNRGRGRTKDKINYWDFDLFAATAAFVVIKGKSVYWASICDSYVMCFGGDGNVKFKSLDRWDRVRANLPNGWTGIPEADRRKILRKTYRNGADKNGKLIGYGVVTGEKTAERYLNFGRFVAEDGDLVFILTDGFANHMDLPSFIKIFRQWPEDLEQKVKKFTARESINNPRKFGSERTMIAIKF